MIRFISWINYFFKFLIFLAGLIIGSFVYNINFYNYSNLISETPSKLILPDLYDRNETNLNCTRSYHTKDYPYINWTPRENRYLLATCQLGQLSNRLSCLRRTLIVAGILNRTLLIPNEDLYPKLATKPYKFDVVLDVTHARHCLGENTVFFLNEFLQSKSKSNQVQVKVDRVLCWNAKCSWIYGFKNWNTIVLPKNFENVSNKMKKILNLNDILDNFGKIDDNIITFGDLFYSREYMSYFNLVPKHLREKECKIIFKPHNAILKTAREFIRLILGKNYASVHLRRTDFMGDGGVVRNYFSTLDVAKCLHEKLASLKMNVLFVATDTFPSEFDLLQTALRGLSPEHKITCVRLPNLQNKPWAQELNALDLAADPMVISILDKVVASLSVVFYGDKNSTFSNQIGEMRALLGIASCHDDHVCRGRERIMGNVDKVIDYLI